jgi:hypothetical protein
MAFLKQSSFVEAWVRQSLSVQQILSAWRMRGTRSARGDESSYNTVQARVCRALRASGVSFRSVLSPAPRADLTLETRVQYINLSLEYGQFRFSR